MKVFSAWFFLFAIIVVGSPVRAATVFFDLQGRSGLGMRFDNENPSASGSGTGGEVGAGISYDTTTKVLTLNVGWGSGQGFSNLTGAVTAAHLHGATASTGVAAFTQSAGVLFSLDGATPGYSSSGTNGGWTNTTVTLTAGQETQLMNGQFYLNAHTSANGGGEIRANLVLVPEPSRALLCVLGVSLATLRRRR